MAEFDMDNMNEGKGAVRYALIAVGVLLSVYLLVLSIKEVKSIGYVGLQQAQQNTITVSGKGESVAIPDIATFTFGVTKEAADAKTAQNMATEIINKAYAYLKENGVAEKDIKNVGYNINPVYDYTQNVCKAYPCVPGKQTLRGYEVSQMIEVKVRKTDDAGKLLSGIGSVGVTNVNGLNFSIDNEDKVKDAARAQAIADAKEKAQVLADQLGVKIGRIMTFNESGDGYPMYYTKATMAGAERDVANQSAPSPVVPGGEQKVTSNVTIVFEIK